MKPLPIGTHGRNKISVVANAHTWGLPFFIAISPVNPVCRGFTIDKRIS